jgi:uncharacterized protein YdeI (YjbR/CyaY-like superfamily)
VAKAPKKPGEPKAFKSPAELRAWLRRNHGSASELTVLLYKKGTGRTSITWPELVDQLLCFGWIDGVRKSAGSDAYTIRITPRRTGSNWSAVNVRRAGELNELGWMEAAGRVAFEARRDPKSDAYSYENAKRLSPEYEREFKSHRDAWSYFASQAPHYRRLAAHYVMSAKREETRRRRLEKVISDSANQSRIDG